jgi:hypothetical protein
MNTADRIYEIVKAMPDEQANQVLDFTEFLKYKQQVKDKSLLSDYLGILKNSPNFNEDPVEWQRTIRSDWD